MSKIDEAISIIKSLGFPRQQQNDRSALCLLALLDLKEHSNWSEAQNPLIGITPIMDYVAEHYNRKYAPNSRETFRRQTMHQFVAGALATYNPDKPKRAVNSPNAVYQIESTALDLIKLYGSPKWNTALDAYLKEKDTLIKLYAKKRKKAKIPVKIRPGQEILISPGKHSQLIKEIIDTFAPIFAPESDLIYVGDTGEKVGYFNEKLLKSLGVEVNKRGKMPDVVFYYSERNWLLLVEAVTSHGPVDPKRHKELEILFKKSKAGLVYVTAFPTRRLMAKYITEISWETEVWVSEHPTHLIHFNGERFLGPY